MKRYKFRAALHDVRVFYQSYWEYRRANKNPCKDRRYGWLPPYRSYAAHDAQGNQDMWRDKNKPTSNQLKTILILTTVCVIVARDGSVLGSGATFTLQVTANRLQDDEFPVACTTTPTPPPMPLMTPLPGLDCASSTPTPYPPSVEEIPELFQDTNHGRLAWLPFPVFTTASPTPPPPQGARPAVMLIHPGNWNTGDAFDVVEAGNDIAAAGYFVVSAFYELAPPNYIPGQPCHELDKTTPGWRMVRETNDIKALVRALREDPRCNGRVGVVGGSAGATLAVTVALDKTPTPNGAWPMWCQGTIDDRPDCAAMLSAIYDFSDWTPPTGDEVTDRRFVRLGMENYAQSTPPDIDTLANLPLNPVVLVRQARLLGWGFKPLFLINSYYDNPTAYHQIVTMSCALDAQRLVRGTDYQRLTNPGDGHAFAYWGLMDPEIGKTVGQRVIEFLDAHLK